MIFKILGILVIWRNSNLVDFSKFGEGLLKFGHPWPSAIEYVMFVILVPLRLKSLVCRLVVTLCIIRIVREVGIVACHLVYHYGE